MTRAFSDGLRRVWSAPLLLASVAVICLLSPLDPDTASRRALFEFVLFGSFLTGGVIDRYARARPTRAYGFFGACGRHLAGLLRLAAIEILIYLGVDNLPLPAAAALTIDAGVNAIATYARVRLVVEDRRSAVGAVLASARFLRRNPSAVLVYLVWIAAAYAAARAVRGAGPILLLPLLASATVFFQSRLAHVRYTAAPRLEWPESPAAEAIANHR